MDRHTLEQRRMKAAQLEEQRKEGKRCLKAFGTQGALWFAAGFSFAECKEKWNELIAEDVKKLTLKIGRSAALFAASMKMQKRLDVELEDGPR